MTLHGTFEGNANLAIAGGKYINTILNNFWVMFDEPVAIASAKTVVDLVSKGLEFDALLGDVLANTPNHTITSFDQMQGLLPVVLTILQSRAETIRDTYDDVNPSSASLAAGQDMLGVQLTNLARYLEFCAERSGIALVAVGGKPVLQEGKPVYPTAEAIAGDALIDFRGKRLPLKITGQQLLNARKSL